MLLVLSSANDPELALFSSCPEVALILPAHLSQSGWHYEVGMGASARLFSSRGVLRASDISGVLTRTQRVRSTELAQIDAEDREYVAAEMTAFLAALVNGLSCPLLNRPSANSLWGPPWVADYWWRTAAEKGFSVCCNRDRTCTEFASLVMLGNEAVRSDSRLPIDALELSRTLAKRAGVNLVEVKFCLTHQALQQVSLRPALSLDLLSSIRQYCDSHSL